MPNSKLTALTENTGPTLDDILYLVNDPAGSPASQKVALSSIAVLLGTLWIPSPYTWTYSTASAFTIAGADITALFPPGTKLKFTNSTLKFAIVKTATYSAGGGGVNTINITANTDYTIANASITSPYYSYGTPPDFPRKLNISTVGNITGYSGTPTINEYAYSSDGRIGFLFLDISGTSNATTLTVVNPFDRTGSTYLYQEVGYCMDNGSAQTNPAQAEIQSNTTVNFYKTLAQGAFTASGTKRIICTLKFDI